MDVADNLTPVGLLGALLDVRAAAFEQENALPLPEQLDREDDARGSSADDADVRYLLGIRAGAFRGRRSRFASAHGLQDGSDAVYDQTDLAVVVVAVALGTGVAGCGDPGSGSFVGEVLADLRDALFDRGEEDCLDVFFESLAMAFRAFGEKEASASGDLESSCGRTRPGWSG